MTLSVTRSDIFGAVVGVILTIAMTACLAQQIATPMAPVWLAGIGLVVWRLALGAKAVLARKSTKEDASHG